MSFELARNWWTLAIRGVVAIIFGILAFVWPGITLLTLVILFAVYALADGFFAIVAAMSASSRGEKWWALLLEGILGIVAGVVTLLVPGITALFLLYIIAFWSLITGIFEVVTAVRLRREISDEWLMGLGGVASVIFGILLLSFPGAGALAVVWLIGAYAIIFGVLLLSLAIRLRTRGREILPAG
jgi:uncharacterized membrane protein HdeD (DUF308 family)